MISRAESSALIRKSCAPSSWLEFLMVRQTAKRKGHRRVASQEGPDPIDIHVGGGYGCGAP